MHTSTSKSNNFTPRNFSLIMSIRPKYPFKQLETGLVGFIANLEKKLQEIIGEIPVYVLSTGDETYYLTSKFERTEEKEIIQKTPRLVLTIEDLANQSDQNTNPYNTLVYNFDNVNYTATFRRRSLEFVINSNLVCSNFIKSLEYFEVMSMLFSKSNVFTYEYLGNTYEGAYTETSQNIEKNSTDASSASRNNVVKNAVSLILQTSIIRAESIQKYDDTIGKEIVFNIISNPGADSTTMTVPKPLTAAELRTLKRNQE